MSVKGVNPVDKRIGSNVRRRRMLLSMSQEKLGDALGLTFQQVQKYEKGTNRISGSRLSQIAAALQCSIPELFDGVSQDGAASLPDPIAALGENGLGVRLAKSFVKLPSKLQHTIVDLCEQQSRHAA